MSNIVVGSGIAGMTLALLLAQQKQDVTLLEAAPSPAPLLNSFKRSALSFDVGFHYAGGLAPSGVLHRWLNALGVWKYIGNDALHPVSEEFHFATNDKYYLPPHKNFLISAVEEQFHETESFEKLLTMMNDSLNHSPFMNPLQEKFTMDIPENITSVSDVLDSLNLPFALKQIMLARCLLLGLRPSETSFEHYSVLSMPYCESSSSLIGGGKTIRDAYLRALEDAGVTVQCNSTLKSLLVEEEELQGVVLENGKELSCERCFFTGHPQQLRSMVPPKVFRPAFFNRIESMEETPHAFMIFAETKSASLQDKVVYLLTQEGFCADRVLDADDPSIYVTGAAPVDGRYPVLAIASIKQDICKKSDQNYSAWKKKYSEKLVNYLETRMPELAPIRLLDAATPSTLRHWVHGSKGSLYGIAHSNENLPILPITRLKGFFMAGQNILLPGLLGALISAAVSAGFAFGHDEILQRFRQGYE